MTSTSVQISIIARYNTTVDSLFVICCIALQGTRPAVPYSRVPFDSFAKKQIKLLALPCTECVDLVYEKLRSITLEILNLVTYQHYTLLDFPDLKNHMVLVAFRLLDERLPKTKKQVNLELYINSVTKPN